MAETTINNPQLPPNPTKFYTHFLYKAIFVSIFLLLLPLFPSQTPDFISRKTINSTSWEFLQLIFVGIAVSYGLFSKRNDETHKEDDPFKPENTQSYVARLLQVSSVFDDDSENKVKTWNNQYYRGEPIIVVAKESDDDATIEKPLLLPVRSLKTKAEASESSAKDSNSKSFIRSNSRRVSRNLSKLNQVESEEDIVLRSPIPWRSRSGRMVMETPSVHEGTEINSIESPSFRYRSSRSSKPVVNSSPEDQIRPSNPETQSIEDVGRQKITKKSSSFSKIPPPPPPPPQRAVNVNVNHAEDYQNRGRRSADFTIKTRGNTRKESELEEYLSHDKEIERFIERKGSQRKQSMDEDIEYPKEEKKELIEDEHEEEEEVKNGDMAGSGDNGPDVDKKADEFIAKFREQIRLQRIVVLESFM